MTKNEVAARKVLVELVRLARTPIRTVAEFINAHELVGSSWDDTQGLSWAAQSRLYDAFVRAAALGGEYGRGVQRQAKADLFAIGHKKRSLTQRNQQAARLVVVELVKLAQTPVQTVGEFILANDVSGVCLGETSGLSQAAHDRLHASFQKAYHLRREAKQMESIRQIFAEHGTAIRNNRVHTLLYNQGSAASNEIINSVRRTLPGAKPAQSVPRLKLVG